MQLRIYLRGSFLKPNEESNSIAEIVQHLLYWNSTWQTRYKESNVNAVPAIGDNNKSFMLSDNQTFDELRKTTRKTVTMAKSHK